MSLACFLRRLFVGLTALLAMPAAVSVSPLGVVEEARTTLDQNPGSGSTPQLWSVAVA